MFYPFRCVIKSRYSSPVDHGSLDDLCTSTYTMSQKLCARYMLGARYLYLKRNVEKFGVRVISRKIRYLDLIVVVIIEYLHSLSQTVDTHHCLT